ncbi:unnamed protein product, partial [Musa acuminata var. zebrina]
MHTEAREIPLIQRLQNRSLPEPPYMVAADVCAMECIRCKNIIPRPTDCI